ncbi:hypothetical protein PN661_003698 [Cronobacter sakazakii]|nr:hypothetical protein [Cronobacter sakazakii]EKK5312972.1 hypothetical protein [Cronobacter sakazakii]
MSEISKERVEALASNILECHDVKPSEVKALAALALLALRERAEPVAWVPQYQLDLLKKSVIVEADLSSMQRFDEVPLYTAPPAPVMPDEIIELLQAARSYVKSCAGSDGHAFGVLMAIDRVCHSSMLQPVSQPYKLS